MKHRAWLITMNYKVNSPPERKLVEEFILTNFQNINYYVFNLEKGQSGTSHYHIFIYLKYATTFESIQKKFPKSYIQVATNNLERVDKYVRKDATNQNPAVSYGELPRKGKRTDLETIYDLLEKGESLKTIRKLFPSQYFKYLNNFKVVQQELIAEKVEDKWTERSVTYIYGDTGLGKTRTVMEKHGYTNCYRVTDYKHPFDTYNNEPVIIFEEFRSSLKLADMLVYLDGYPVKLPARYHNKTAVYKYVYIISNIPLFEQYASILKNHQETYAAFLRRINRVEFFCPYVGSQTTSIVEFNDPYEALTFSHVLFLVWMRRVDVGYIKDQWFYKDYDKYKIFKKMVKISDTHDIKSYSYYPPKYDDKNQHFKDISDNIIDLKKAIQKAHGIEELNKDNELQDVDYYLGITEDFGLLDEGENAEFWANIFSRDTEEKK